MTRPRVLILHHTNTDTEAVAKEAANLVRQQGCYVDCYNIRWCGDRQPTGFGLVLLVKCEEYDLSERQPWAKFMKEFRTLNLTTYKDWHPGRYMSHNKYTVELAKECAEKVTRWL